MNLKPKGALSPPFAEGCFFIYYFVIGEWLRHSTTASTLAVLDFNGW